MDNITVKVADLWEIVNQLKNDKIKTVNISLEEPEDEFPASMSFMAITNEDEFPASMSFMAITNEDDLTLDIGYDSIDAV